MKKKGFTLIELLAVIVILALIALIVTPIVTNIISSAKKGAAVSSAYGYIDGVEKYMLMHDMNSEKYPIALVKGDTYYYAQNSSFVPDGETDNGIYLSSFVTVKGEEPVDGYVTIGEKNKVSYAKMVINGYEVICENGVCNAGNKSDLEPTTIDAYSVGFTPSEENSEWNVSSVGEALDDLYEMIYE